MGICIYYKGVLRAPESIPELISETSDICQTLNWPHEVIDIPEAGNVKGILIQPVEKCETIQLTFLPNGIMFSPFHFMITGQISDEPDWMEKPDWLFTKTQYAGREIHKAIVKLMRYLSNKYFREFEFQDEAGYWESEDDEVLNNRFDRMDFLLDAVGKALDTLHIEPGTPTESVADQIEKLLSGLGLHRKT